MLSTSAFSFRLADTDATALRPRPLHEQPLPVSIEAAAPTFALIQLSPSNLTLAFALAANWPLTSRLHSGSRPPNTPLSASSTSASADRLTLTLALAPAPAVTSTPPPAEPPPESLPPPPPPPLSPPHPDWQSPVSGLSLVSDAMPQAATN